MADFDINQDQQVPTDTKQKVKDMGDGTHAIMRAVQITSADGTVAVVNDDGQLQVVLDGRVDDNNSTSATLGAGATFTGSSVNILNFALLFVTVFSDVASATDGLSVEQGSDGINWDSIDNFTIPASTGKTFSFQTAAKFMRIRYTNGASPQTAFRLQVVLKKTNSKPSSHRIQESISTEDDAELVKAVLTARDPSGDFINIEATDSNNLRTTDAENGLAIAKGDVQGTTFIHKFGNAADIDTGDGLVDIWDGADSTLATGKIPTYTFSTTDNIDSISSSDAGDAQDIEIGGLDINFAEVTQTITLNGQARVALDTDLIRVFRMINRSATDIAGEVYCYVNGAITLGVPDVPADVRAIINGDNNQTLMSIFTIPAAITGYMRSWFASMSTKKAAASVIQVRARPVGEVFQLKHISAILTTGNSYVHHEYVEPEIFQPMTDVVMRADSDTNDVGVAGGFDVVLVDD